MKRHFLRLQGVSTLTYYLSSFLGHISLFAMFAIYVWLRIPTWPLNDANKNDEVYYTICTNTYVIVRFIVGFSLVPFLYLFG